LVFDLRVASDPGDAPYVGVDRQQYVEGFAAGTVWPELARDLRAIANRRGARQLVVAYGGHGTGPIGLAAQIGRPVVQEGIVNAGFFRARAGGVEYHFVPYSTARTAPVLIAQEANVRRPPKDVLRRYHVADVAQRPDGSS